MKLFKIRASAASEIFGGAMNSPTVKQLAELDRLTKLEKRTAKQEETLAELIAKRDSKPELSAGAKTYCKQWLKEQLYGRYEQFSNKYTEKGIQCEDDGIKMVADHMGYGMVFKNTLRVENDYFEGECDLLLPDIIEEIKSSWSCFTFPLFEAVIPDAKYILQNQVYMDLYNRRKGAVNYCLLDAPDDLVNREAYIESRKAGFDEVDLDLWQKVKDNMTYSNLPISLRIKRYEFTYDEAVINALKQQVILCRAYIDTLVNGII